MQQSRQFNSRFLFLIITLFLFSGCAIINPKAKADYTLDVANMDFVFVKGGTFQMGSTEGYQDEQPVRAVTIRDLFVGMYEVTFEQYAQFCTLPECELPYNQGWGLGNRPVIHITWHDAVAYAAWLSEQTGYTLRLPTEAEWEYFARAGTTTKYWTGESLPDNGANCRNCGTENASSTLPVGTFAPNPWGIYDTIGNVREWTQDDYQKTYANAPLDGSPRLVATPPGKSVRGGSFNDGRDDVRSSSRDWLSPSKNSKHVGFRLVMEPDANTPVPPSD